MKNRALSYVIPLTAFTTAYIIAAEIGFALQVDDTLVSPVWPAAGVALGALLIFGYRMLPGVIAGAFATQYIAVTGLGNVSSLKSVLISLMVAAGCAVSAFAGAFLIKTSIDQRNIIETTRDVVKFVMLAAIASSTIGATVYTLALGLSDIIQWGDYSYLWWTWWTGAGVSILLIVPVMVSCCARPEFIKYPPRILEAALFLAFFLIIHELAIGDLFPQLVATHPFDNILGPFFLFLLLIAVIRFEQLGSTVFVFLAWALLIWDTSRDLGPFIRETPIESLLTLQALFGLLAVVLMALAAARNERRAAVLRLNKSKDDLKERIRERTNELSAANIGLEKEIAERISAEEKTMEASEKLKAQYKGMPIPTYTWQKNDDKFILVDYNDAAEQITQGGVVNLIGQRARDLYKDSPEVLTDMEQCFKEKKLVKRDLLYTLRSTGEDRFLATSYAFVPPDLVMVHTEDITDRKKAEEQIINQSNDLAERNSDLSSLYKVSTAISRTIDLKQLLLEVLGAITGLDLFNVEKRGGVFIVEGDSMNLVAHLGHTDQFLDLHKDMKVGKCLCGLAARTGELIVSSNSDHDSNHSIRYTDMEPHGHVIVPLKVANRIVGVMYFYFPADFDISKRKLELLSSIGNQLAIAIENSRLFEETKKLSLHDALTGLANRNLMNVELTKAFALSQRSRIPLSLIMMDLDHFKKYNDAYGHAAGDRLLVGIANITTNEIRDADIAVRYGGEEFLIILPNTGIEEACEVAERLRVAVEQSNLGDNEDDSANITVSLGVATNNENVTVSDRLIMMADDALYAAKRSGRNTVRTWSPRNQLP